MRMNLTSTGWFSYEATRVCVCVCEWVSECMHGTVNRYDCCVWGREILMILLNMSMIHWRLMYVYFDEKQSYWSFLFLNNLWWMVILFWPWWRTELCVMSKCEQFSSQMVHHLISLPCLCLSGQGVFWSLDRKRETCSWLPHSPDWLLWISSSGGFKRHCSAL
jgi:hypothetical protein